MAAVALVCVCVCMYVCACVRACVRVCVGIIIDGFGELRDEDNEAKHYRSAPRGPGKMLRVHTHSPQ